MITTYSLSIGTILRGNSYSYQIERILGQGSFGITYLASVKMQGVLGEIDANIKVAVKEFFMKEINGREGSTVTCGSKGGLFDDYRSKFVREATNLSRLKHPNIIKVLECFEANNTVYYAMEYIDGGNLDNLINSKHGLSEKETIEYAIQIADALSYMHDNKVLHLDLKPGNIMLNNRQAILIDFGLSKQYDADGNPETSTTIGGGTPGYAPLEQFNYHEGKGFAPTMDIYALGGTMFKMLTGQRPPNASEIFNEGFPVEELEKRNISENIISVVSTSMQPSVKSRYQSVKELISYLTVADDEETVLSTDNNGISFVSFQKDNSVIAVYENYEYFIDYGFLKKITDHQLVAKALKVFPERRSMSPRKVNDVRERLISILSDRTYNYLVIAYNSLNDYIILQRILNTKPGVKHIRLVKEEELWALCQKEQNGEDCLVELRNDNRFCLYESEIGVVEIYETGNGKATFSTNDNVRTISIEKPFEYFIIGAWIQYNIKYDLNFKNYVLLNILPFKIDVIVKQQGRVRDVINIIKKNSTIPCKKTEQIDYGDKCDIELLINDSHSVKVDTNKLFGYNLSVYSITINIDTAIMAVTLSDTETRETRNVALFN